MTKNNNRNNKKSYLFINHFCLFWQSESVTFSEAVRELKSKFTKVKIYLIIQKVTSFF